FRYPSSETYKSPDGSRAMLMTVDKTLTVLWLGCVVWIMCWVDSCVMGWFTGYGYHMWATAAAVYLGCASIKVDVRGKTVLITGCDSGFGLNVAKHLHTLGFQVVAGCLLADKNGEGAEELRKIGSERLHIIQLDITKEDQINKAFEDVKKLIPDGKLWGLLNNAGYATLGFAEWLPIEDTRKNLEVNVVGLISMTKTFLPLIRNAKGRIVNVASVIGRCSCPMFSTYSMTKHAVEGYSDSLRLEMKSWGVKVCMIEPGNYSSGTNFLSAAGLKSWQESLWKSASDEVKSVYGQNSIDAFMNFFEGMRGAARQDVSAVVNAMTEALTQKFPQARYMPQDPGSRFVATLSTHFPEFLYDLIIMKGYKDTGFDFQK
ncbi:unnamed protein product, partial [Meganyctiphanes norvegica]